MSKTAIFNKAYKNIPDDARQKQADYESARAAYVSEGVRAGLFKRSRARFSVNPDDETAPEVEPLFIAPIKEILAQTGL